MCFKKNSHFQERRGFMLAVSSPSGTGKSTLCKLLYADPKTNLSLSISVTTREPRSKEKDGKDYHFVSLKKFKSLKEEGKFLECAKVHGNYYGTLRDTVETSLRKGKNVLFDIDWQGVAQLKKTLPKDLLSVFLFPPSMKELEARLQKRGQDCKSVIESRLLGARLEIEKSVHYDYLLINDTLELTLKRLKCIIFAEQQKITRLIGISDWINSLLTE